MAASKATGSRKIASNFLALSVAEILCRGISVAVTLGLAKTLGRGGYGRIEFAFNVVFWLVLLVRDGFEVISSREIARHPRLVRPLVNHILAVKLLLATILLIGLIVIGCSTLTGPRERMVLGCYGLMLLTTALGLDFVFRGKERMGLIAVSLCIRTALYAAGVWLLVRDESHIIWVPLCLVTGEAFGIGLVWAAYAREYGMPRPVLGARFLKVFLRRGRPVALIQISQTVIGSVDVMLVGLMSTYASVGLYSAPYRMINAVLTFGLIFQQVVFPSMARSWRETPEAGRRALDALVRVLVSVLIPLAVGTTLLANALVGWILPEDFATAGLLLALGIWRAPLLTLAYLYQMALISLNREIAGLRLLFAGAIGSGPLVAILGATFGLEGASAAVVIVGLVLMLAGYICLAGEGRSPAWHHHAARPLLASLAMAPVCLWFRDRNLPVAVLSGAATYALTLIIIGGLNISDLRAVLHPGQFGLVIAGSDEISKPA
jgi:O-antigen/teichoic acid export membrane protein